jgi:hypothetical protein
MRKNLLMPFEYKHHQTAEQKHAVVEYQKENGENARFLNTYASGNGSISFRVVDADGNGVNDSSYTINDIKNIIDKTERYSHYQIFENSTDNYSIHAPIDRINENTLWFDGAEISYTVDDKINKDFAGAYNYTRTHDISDDGEAQELVVTKVVNIGMRGSLGFYILNEGRILEQRKESKFNQESLLRALQESAPVAQIKSEDDLQLTSKLEKEMASFLEAASNAEIFLRIDNHGKSDGYSFLPFTLIEKQIIMHSADWDLTSKERTSLESSLEDNKFVVQDHHVESITSGPLKPEFKGVPLAPDDFQP